MKQEQLVPKGRSIKWFKERVEDRCINLFPEYQRGFAWKPAQSSRLIVTALCARVIPPVILHQRVDTTGDDEEKDVYDVVDGKQRLGALLAFAFGSEAERYGLPTTATELQGLDQEEFDGWNGMRTADLHKNDLNRFLDYELLVVVIPANLDSDIVFEIYQDINSGGTRLSEQQLRRAIFYGQHRSYIALLDRLRQNTHFLAAQGRKDVDSVEEKDGEDALRALLVLWGPGFMFPRVKRSLNHEVRYHADRAKALQLSPDAYLAQKERDFERTLALGVQALGADAAFRRWHAQRGQWEYHPHFFALSLCALRELIESRRVSALQLVHNGGAVREAIQRLFADARFGRSFGKWSKARFAESERMLEDAIVRACAGSSEDGLEDAQSSELSSALDPRRSFGATAEQRRALHAAQHGRCALCGEAIDPGSVDDAALFEVDHIVPWARGGVTEASNAQLVHRACNRSKGAGHPGPGLEPAASA